MPAKIRNICPTACAEALLNLLSKVPGLQVAARTSAFSFKGRDVDIAAIGHQLRVSNVLRGSVSKTGNHLRVTAQLVRADSGSPLWSQTYDRELGDVFRIQDDIAAAVVKALKVSYLGSTALRNLRTQNSEAYLVFLQGRAKMETDQLADYKVAASRLRARAQARSELRARLRRTRQRKSAAGGIWAHR